MSIAPELPTFQALAITCLTVLVLFGCEKSADRETAVGLAKFPAIPLKGIDRADTNATALGGKVLVVNVWATWCAPCRKEMPSLQRLHAQLDPLRASVIGVSVENDEHQVREWLRQSRIGFPNYLDSGTPSAREILRITSFPQTFIVSADGTLIARVEGPRDWGDAKWLALVRSAYVPNAGAQQ